MPTPAPTIDDTQARKVLRQVQIYAYRQWHRDGYAVDLSEYEDAGMPALLRCLARFDPTRGVQFATYAEHQMDGAVRDAASPYQVWRHGRVGRWRGPSRTRCCGHNCSARSRR